MDCTQCREALSTRLDGENSPAERGAIEVHLAACAGCCQFADDAARLARIVCTAVATREPDVCVELLFTIDGLAAVLHALADLDRASTTCATAMMALNTPDMVSATRAALDCADIAGAVRRVLSRPTATDPGVIRAVLEAVVTAADRCAVECGQHACHHDHCRVHSASAQRAAELCRAELANIACGAALTCGNPVTVLSRWVTSRQ